MNAYTTTVVDASDLGLAPGVFPLRLTYGAHTYDRIEMLPFTRSGEFCGYVYRNNITFQILHVYND